jgi:hypothetical protein
MQNQILIPVELCKFALSQRKTSEVALWLFLKSVSSGHFLMRNELIQTIYDRLHYNTKKTLLKHLNWLIRKRWITVNGKTGSHRIISMDQLSRKYHFVSRSCGVFCIDDFDTISGFFAGTVIAYCIREKGQSVHRKHGARKYCPYPFVTITKLEKFLGVPRSTAIRFKKQAISAGYIRAKHRFEKLLLPVSDYNFHKKYGTEETRNFRYRRGAIWEQKLDMITSNIVLRKRRNYRGKKWTLKESIHTPENRDRQNNVKRDNSPTIQNAPEYVKDIWRNELTNMNLIIKINTNESKN